LREGRRRQHYSKVRGRYTVGGGKFRFKTISGGCRYGKAGRKKRLSCLACCGDPAHRLAGSGERFTRIYVYTRVYTYTRAFVRAWYVCAACFMLRVCTAAACTVLHARFTMHRAPCSANLHPGPFTLRYSELFRAGAVSQRSCFELKSSRSECVRSRKFCLSTAS